VSTETDVPPGDQRPKSIVFVPGSHLDLFWLGSYQTCLDRGADIIKSYLDRCQESPDETFMIDSVVFAAEFLQRHPDYTTTLARLLAQGRVDISVAYVDRWENLVLAESIIRNVALGKRWLRDVLNHDSRVALHPDLPGLNPQTPQLYRSSGVDFYASARKIFPEGRVWRAVAPDGTALLMLRWPGHYNFVPLRLSDLPPDLPRWGDWELEFEDLDERFPLGTLPVSAIVGDLTEPADFPARYGRELADFMTDYAARLPGVSIGFSTPTRVLTPYRDTNPPLAEVHGGIPSVWGVSADESAAFFRRSRRNEALLLAAETAAVLGGRRGRPAFPPDISGWGGVFDEDAFFARKDPVRDFDDLWRLHLFTQDHNGGGQEGTLSSFQKQVRQDRLALYCRAVIDHALGRPGHDVPVVFNPGLHTGRAVVRVDPDEPVYATLLSWHDQHPEAPIWATRDALGRVRLTVGLTSLASVGHRALTLADLTASGATVPVKVNETEQVVSITNGDVLVEIDRTSGQLNVVDLVRATSWGDGLAMLHAVAEVGNDVTLATDDTEDVWATVIDTTIVRAGPAVSVRSHQRLLDTDWYVQATVYPGHRDVDLEVATRWPGTAGWQVRLGLALDVNADQVAYGTPYHRTRWTDVSTLAGPAVRDEVQPADYASYREIQHWVQVDRADGCLVVAGTNPGVHLADNRLSAVLMRTAVSCGDPRFHWDNHGEQVWEFTLRVSDHDPPAAMLANEFCSRPMVLLADADESAGLVGSTGDPVHLGSIATDGDATLLRLVNLSARPAHVVLTGDVLGGSAELIELDGRPTVPPPRVGPEGVVFDLDPWRVSTLRITE
jgi:alpha-mannosidase